VLCEDKKTKSRYDNLAKSQCDGCNDTYQAAQQYHDITSLDYTIIMSFAPANHYTLSAHSYSNSNDTGTPSPNFVASSSHRKITDPFILDTPTSEHPSFRRPLSKSSSLHNNVSLLLHFCVQTLYIHYK
jgi:hypothetical protein